METQYVYGTICNSCLRIIISSIIPVVNVMHGYLPRRLIYMEPKGSHQSFVNKERCPDKDRRFKRFVTLL